MMGYLIKTAVAVLVMVSASELSKRSLALSAIILALPIISFTTYTLIWLESRDNQRVADLALQNFYYVLPVMPILPFFSWLLRLGFGFLSAMVLSTILVVLLFWIFRKYIAV
jgi:ABC-type multidrug transport system permease subunit